MKNLSISSKIMVFTISVVILAFLMISVTYWIVLRQSEAIENFAYEEAHKIREISLLSSRLSSANDELDRNINWMSSGCLKRENVQELILLQLEELSKYENFSLPWILEEFDEEKSQAILDSFKNYGMVLNNIHESLFQSYQNIQKYLRESHINIRFIISNLNSLENDYRLKLSRAAKHLHWMSEYSLLGVVALCIVFCLGAVVFSRRIGTKISKAVGKISDNALKMAEDGMVYDVVDKSTAGFEMNGLEMSFNEMVNVLKKRHDDSRGQITQYKQEIIDVREDVKKEVAVRTRNLREHSEELERTQIAMLYMVEDLNRQAKQLRKTQSKLVRREKLTALGQLASSVAHELRNPLGTIKNVIYYLNILDAGKGNSEVVDSLKIVDKAVEHANKIIEDLLDFARVREPNKQMVNINDVIKEVVDRFQVHQGIEVVEDFSLSLPKLAFDVLQMQQVFYNIVQNALQAMIDKGKLIVTTVQENNNIRIYFKDNGPGITKENLENIFEPLFSTKAKGTGLGLNVCKSLVSGHDGKLLVESALGKGTTFIVELPIRRVGDE